MALPFGSSVTVLIYNMMESFAALFNPFVGVDLFIMSEVLQCVFQLHYNIYSKLRHDVVLMRRLL